ncbi:MAG: PTS-dependent dihydroxyacetone kinase phosphotransferase subunit DhaM [Treponema sp.]|jgi:dihydroxyacetone kinase phosphotransfer subunit|nr:PTS-dependent dihydroxyacetone kinase phosphotransferase subunit DhaM [Treponema sp.]
MVGLVLVSHSRALAEAAAELARKVSAEEGLPITAAGGTGEGREELGTDATDIMEAIERVYSDDGVLILMDMGSAVLSSQMALDLLGDRAEKVKLCSAPFVEGAIGAAVQLSIGSPLGEIIEECLQALLAKREQIGDVKD